MTSPSTSRETGRDPMAPTQLFDFQVNGFGGVDFQHAGLNLAGLLVAVRALRDNAVGGILLTLITDTVDNLCRQFARIESLRATHRDLEHFILGYHLEGPWLSPLPGFCGAHSADLMRRPDWRDFALIHEAPRGRIRLVTLAPE